MPVIESASAKPENATATAAAKATRRREKGKKVTPKVYVNPAAINRIHQSCCPPPSLQNIVI
jgi:hypothetical protein